MLAVVVAGCSPAYRDIDVRLVAQSEIGVVPSATKPGVLRSLATAPLGSRVRITTSSNEIIAGLVAAAGDTVALEVSDQAGPAVRYVAISDVVRAEALQPKASRGMTVATLGVGAIVGALFLLHAVWPPRN